jgi:hypothetical protein
VQQWTHEQAIPTVSVLTPATYQVVVTLKPGQNKFGCSAAKEQRAPGRHCGPEAAIPAFPLTSLASHCETAHARWKGAIIRKQGSCGRIGPLWRPFR